MNHMLAEGDVLTVWIREKENSGQIRPVKLPFAIVYEDEDLPVSYTHLDVYKRQVQNFAGS